MLELSDYEPGEQIYRSEKTLVYRGIRKSDGLKVVIKTHAEEYPTAEIRARFHNERELGKILEGDYHLNYYSLDRVGHRLLLIMEDCGARGLQELIPDTGFALEKFLPLAIQIVSALSQTHRQDVIHKDIKPANIVVNSERNWLKIIDFGIAAALKRESRGDDAPVNIEGTLAFISPEQTGRMNRPLDYRGDYYSLGVTFFLMLTGRLPFENKDPLELIHAHIARVPPRINEIRPDLPASLSEMVFKLMSKSADERYQSVSGLGDDLQTCLEQLRTRGVVEDFEIARSDDRDRFTYPRKLYGREAELNDLLSAFERIQEGPGELLLVTGYSGVGKSSLVRELHKSVLEEYGYFIADGKYEQYSQDIPYSAIIQTFSKFCERLLGGSQEELADWKKRILAGLGKNVGALIELIPELEYIIGTPAAVLELTPGESRNRLHMLFRSFIKTIGDTRRPLVVFLDDLQWADSASLELIKNVMADDEVRNFLLIGAYRDNEVAPTDPLMVTLESLRKAGGVINTIDLKELSRESVEELIEDSFRLEGEKLAELTDLITDKTGGNAFFTLTLLESLTRERLLEFNYQKRIWEYDIKKIRSRDIAENLVDIMTARIDMLPESSRKTLNLAACLGNRFELGNLAIVDEKTPGQTLLALRDAVRDGLILALDDNYKIIAAGADEADKQPRAWFKFLHDRVQQAAYNLIGEKERKLLHLRIGRLLLAQFQKRERREDVDAPELIFPILGHYNRALEYLSDRSEKQNLVVMNLRGARKARSSAALGEARAFLESALSLQPEDSWQSEYDLSNSINRLLSEVLQGEGEYALAEEYLRTGLKWVRTAPERADIHAALMALYVGQFRMAEALEEGRKGLELLGVNIAREGYDVYLREQKEIFEKQLGERSVESLSETPEMRDSVNVLIMKILSGLTPALINVDLWLFAATMAQMANFTLKEGQTLQSSIAYGSYGMVLIACFGEYTKGIELARLSLRLLESLDNSLYKSGAIYFYLNFLAHWNSDIRTLETLAAVGYGAAREAGEVQHMAYFLTEQFKSSYFQGKSLTYLSEKAEENLKMGRKMGLQPIILSIWGLKLALEGLLPRVVESDSSEGENSPEETFVRNFIQKDESPNNFMAFGYNVIALREKLVLRDIEAAIYHLNQVDKFSLAKFISQMATLELYFLKPLVLIETHRNQEKRALPEKLREEILGYLEKLELWSLHCPENFLHWYKLVQAEYEGLTGDAFKALGLYEEAIRAAAEGEFLQNQALACELTARFYFSRELPGAAQVYLRESFHLYGLWGARKKTEQLEEEFGELLLSQERRKVRESEQSFATLGTGTNAASSWESDTPSSTGTSRLDFQSLLKSSNIIIQELKLEGVLERILDIMIENAGAERGVIILERNGEFIVEAQRYADRRDAKYFRGARVSPGREGEDVTETFPLALSAVNYVTRKKEAILTDDAYNDSRYTGDLYIRENKIRSLLCLPIFRKDELMAILYLENNLNTAVFTKDRLELLGLLSGQFCIALDNARLYDALEERVRERTLELEQTHQALLETAHRAGMAEVAAGVLHNVGNALNSAFVPTGLLREKLDNSRLGFLSKAIELILDNKEKSGDLFSSSERGQKLPAYLEALGEQLDDENIGMRENLDRLQESLSYITEVIRLQENYAGGEQLKEELVLRDILEDALQMEAAALEEEVINVAGNFENMGLIRTGRHKLMMILLNLLSNAREALLDKEGGPKEIRLYSRGGTGGKVILYVEDNGQGIPGDLLDRIFQNGFSTRKHGRGFGLHNAANAATELGGHLSAQSDGPGTGARFILELPAGLD